MSDDAGGAIGSMTSAQLKERIRALDGWIIKLTKQLELDGGRNRVVRSSKIGIGAGATIVMLFVAPPAGLATLIGTGLSVLLTADGVREDAQAYNRTLRAELELPHLRQQLAELDAELRRRGF